MKFQRFKRGSVVMVEFSPSMGSEIKGETFSYRFNEK